MTVLVIYETTRGRTRAMAEAICKGVESEGKTCNLVESKNFRSLGEPCAIAMGSSTRMKRILPKLRRVLAELPDLPGTPAAAFGSYGWSGEAPDTIAEELKKSGAVLVEDQPIKAKDYPSEESLERCKELGVVLAKHCD
ncbi:FprA family A-type flavoprotein [Candidatus Thorarchaeota archaeon]|nr:MAG: FprA family A-type flavoprotein [Candidatus Thorarchaeota archaeon]